MSMLDTATTDNLPGETPTLYQPFADAQSLFCNKTIFGVRASLSSYEGSVDRIQESGSSNILQPLKGRCELESKMYIS
jgi:hypothetical protein